MTDLIEWPANATVPDQSITLRDSALRAASVVRPQAQLTIGRSTDDPNHQFSVISGIAIDREDRVYVYDRYAFRVRVYDRNGSFVRDIGRRGNGPGEISDPRGPAPYATGNGLAISGDTLWLIDGNRIVAFDRNGTYLGASPDSLRAYSLHVTEHGLFVARSQYFPGDVNYLAFRALFYDPAGHSMSQGFAMRYRLIESHGEPNLPMLSAPVPLPEYFYAIGSGGSVYTVVGDSFHVRRLAFDGHIEKEYVADAPRRRVTRQDVKDYTAQRINRLLTLRGPAGEPAATAEEIPMYERRIAAHPRANYREAIRQLIVSDAGDILVQRSDIEDRPYRTPDPGAVIEWLWLSAAGDPIARVTLPVAFTPKVFRGCELYGVTEDAEGAQLVQRFVIIPPDAGDPGVGGAPAPPEPERCRERP